MLKTSTQLLKLAIPLSQFGGLARFCSVKTNTPPRNEHFFPFSKEKTVKGLHLIQESLEERNPFDAKNLIKLDPLSETPHSETYRVFDRYHKKFFAEKTLNLHTLNAWEQLNLSLKQYTMENPKFAKVVSIDYNEKAQKAKIYTELDQKLVGDYSFFRIKNHLEWSNRELESLTWQLASQMNELKKFDAFTNSLGGMKMFIDEKAHCLKLFEYSDLKIGSKNLDMDAIVYSLVQIMNPYTLVHNAEEARYYLKNNHPDFLPALKRIEEAINNSGNGNNLVSAIEKHLLNERDVYDKEFQRFVSNKLATLIEEKNQGNMMEDIGLVYQGLGDHQKALRYLQDSLSQKISEFGEYNSKTSQGNLQIAALNREMQKFDEATYYLDKALSVEKSLSKQNYLLLSQIQNEYGKLYSAKGKFQEALKHFKEAEEALKRTSEGCPVVKKDIQKNIKLANQGKKFTSYSYFEDPEKGRDDEFVFDARKKEGKKTEVLAIAVFMMILAFAREQQDEDQKEKRQAELIAREAKEEAEEKQQQNRDVLHELLEKEENKKKKKEEKERKKEEERKKKQLKNASNLKNAQEQKTVVVDGNVLETQNNGKTGTPVFFFFLFASLGIFGLTL